MQLFCENDYKEGGITLLVIQEKIKGRLNIRVFSSSRREILE